MGGDHGKTETRQWGAALAVGLAYFLIAFGSLTLARWSTGLAAIWPANALLLFYMLLARRRAWGPALLFVLLVSIPANMAGSGTPALLAAIFGALNVIDPLAAAILIRAAPDREIDLGRTGDLRRFAFGSLLGATLSASLAAAAITVISGQHFATAWQGWFLSSLLGYLIVTPILLAARRAVLDWPGTGSSRSLAEAVLVLGLVAAVSMGVFLQHSWPLLFLITPPVLLATFRLRTAGATLSALIVALTGLSGTMLGSGPIALAHGSVGAHLALLQAFLATIILTTLPIAAVLAERDRFSRRVQESEQRFRSVVEVVSEVIFRTDARGRWTFLNPAWERMSGYSVEDSLGQSFLHHVLAEDRAALLENLMPLLDGTTESVRNRVRFRNAEGEERWLEILSHRLADGEGRLIGSAGTIVDISDRVALAAHAENARCQAEREAAAALRLAATDELTGLASRRAFLAYFEEQLAESEDGRALSLALFDLDHFKQVNDRYGHAAGDEVLRRVAAIAGRCVREGDLVGRLGGEEFAILMPGATIEQAARAAERLRAACLQMSRRDDTGPTVTISIGVASARPGSTTAALLREADAALYRAKAEGRNCLRLAA